MAVGPGSVPDWAAKISQALWCSQKEKQQRRISVEIRKFYRETPRSQVLSPMPATSGLTSSSPPTLFSKIALSLARTLNREAHG